MSTSLKSLILIGTLVAGALAISGAPAEAQRLDEHSLGAMR